MMTSLFKSLLGFCAKPLSYQRKGGGLLLSFAAPYLLLVSFSSGNINDFGANMIGAINNSPFDGVAVSLRSAYDTTSHKEADYEQAVARIKHGSHKQVWPWVFFNRAIGYSQPKGQALNLDRQKAFKGVRGVDLDDKAGALSDFYENVRLALRIAKKLGSPGILVDLEAYNNYDINDLDHLATAVGLSKTETVGRLRRVGQEVADITAQEYPTATIWFTFTALGDPQGFMSVTYIAQGLLQRAKGRHYPLMVVSGGMDSGYCYASLNDMQTSIQQRKSAFQQSLKEYPALRLGGTIALWKDAKQKQAGYFTRNKCGLSPVRNLQQFRPYLDQLFASYNYVWIYAASMVNYDPYDPSLAGDYNRTIEEALERVR